MSNDAILLGSTGDVFVERNGKTIELNVGDPIFEADTIITADDCTADISFSDGSKARISPSTTLTLKDYDFGPGEEPSFILNLAEGAMRSVSGEIVKQNPEAFSIITPRATTGIRGTEILSVVNGAHETHAIVYIAEGNTVLITRSDGQTISLNKPLQLATIEAGDAGPLQMQTFSVDQMDSFLQAIAPAMGNNIPTNKEEQGDWQPLNQQKNSNELEENTGNVSSVVILHTEAEAQNAANIKTAIHENSNGDVLLAEVATGTDKESELGESLADGGADTDESEESTNSDDTDDEDDDTLGDIIGDIIDSIIPSIPSGAIGINLGPIDNETVLGGNGNDNIKIVSMSNSSIINAGYGHDEIEVGSMSNSSIINGGDGNDNITVFMMRNDSEINGGYGDDNITVSTMSTDSEINGGYGDDNITVNISMGTYSSINGGDGDDTIIINAFNSSNATGAEIPTLTGGNGADTFIINPTQTINAVQPVIITDFDVNSDTLRLDDLVYFSSVSNNGTDTTLRFTYSGGTSHFDVILENVIIPAGTSVAALTAFNIFIS